VFSEAVEDGGRNAGVASVQTVFENGVARNTYDPKRGYLDNVRERMMAAGITGAALKGGLEIIGKVHAGKNPQVLAETQKIFRVEKSPIEINAKQIEYRNSGIDLKAKLNEKLGKINKEQAKTEQIAQTEAVKLIKQAKQSEPKVMQDLQSIAQQTNGKMVGLEYRFKSEESLTRKIADRTQEKVDKAVKNGKDVESVRLNSIAKEAEKNNDALRYTIAFSPDKYVEGYDRTVKALEKQGYEIKQSDNYWLTKGTEKDTGYRGINATFVSPSGQKFELQFHTPESFKFKNDNHHLYEVARKPNVSEERKREIKQLNIKLAEPLISPTNIEKIGGHK